MNTTRRKSHCTSAAIVMALSCCVLFTPVRAGASDSVERWNIAMTDYAAGQPPPGLPPFVEARAFRHGSHRNAGRAPGRKGEHRARQR